jgi:hypothetical protein
MASDSGVGTEAYLGALEARAGDAPALEASTQLELLLVVAPQVVLYPGATLPMRAPRHSALEVLLRSSGDALLAVSSNQPTAGDVCCVARLERAAPLADNATELVAVARGVARGTVLALRPGGVLLSVLPEAADRPQQPPMMSAHAHASVWRSHRPEALAARLRAAPALLAVADAASLASLTPAELSWAAASKLPLDACERRALLQEPSAAVRLHRLLVLVSEDAVLRCASCGVHWASGEDVVASGATDAFVNAHGYVHDMCTVSTARNLFVQGRPTAQDSWFAGHAWQIASCRACLAHAGWLFTAVPHATELPHLPAAFWGLRRGAFTHAARHAATPETSARE